MGIDWEEMLGAEGDALADAYELAVAEAGAIEEFADYTVEDTIGQENRRMSRYYINCPYSEKDEVKALGARWDVEKKKWYYTNEKDSSKFSRWEEHPDNVDMGEEDMPHSEHGAFDEDLWELYRLVPKMSIVEYFFYKEGNEDPLLDLRIEKPDISDERAKAQLDRCLEEYGPGPYRLKIEWRYGFGNNILIEVFKH